ncbi:MAG: septum formation protein Maf [Clostridiaceae bacterium]|nr:septum formation protein Maf [Clostridiaceae bacterium]
MKLILASQSPRRSDLLSMAQVPFEVIPANCDEETILEDLRNAESEIDWRTVVERLALAKAHAVLGDYPDALILAADTIVTLDGVVFGKPVDACDAKRMLRTLAGRTHVVDTGVALVTANSEEVFSNASHVTFKPLSPVIEALIDRYVETGMPLDKAGAYGIQELGGLLIERIEGDFFAVMGLPIAEVYERLQVYSIGE